jgi:hypothetical protein
MSQELDMYTLMRLPHPWPVSSQTLILSTEFNGQQVDLAALPDGRMSLQVSGLSFISQPIDIHSTRPEFAFVRITHADNKLELSLSGDSLLEDKPGVPRHILRIIQGAIPDEVSLNDPNASAACRAWIQNRKLKFATPATPRPDRRSKTVQEQALDLQNSALSLRDLQQQVLNGKRHLLGHLAVEMRASVYWPRLKGNQGDSQPTAKYNPLLLRMASLADLPLPVYSIPKRNLPTVFDSTERHYLPVDAPRIRRVFATDQVQDVQESLVNTTLRLGQAPSRNITALDAIKELAHTMGAAHYDEDASEFLDFMESFKSSEGDGLTIFMCQTAEALASLSEWVLSELKTRNLIA